MTLADRIQVFLFDLDNTLYHPGTGLLEAGDALTASFIAQRLRLAHAEADALRARLWREYGATARGLEVEHAAPQREFYAGSIERLDPTRYLRPDPRLAGMLSGLQACKYVFTNSTALYARKVLAALGIPEAMDGVFDIEFSAGRPKPYPPTYERVLAALDQPARQIALVEDTEENLKPAAALGMVTIKLGERPVGDCHLHLAALHDLPCLLGRG